MIMWRHAANHAIGMLLAVLVFALYLTLPPFRTGASQVFYNPVLGVWHRPNYSGVKIRSCYNNAYSFDEQGLRPGEQESGTNQIVVLGDSQMEATMLPDYNIFHNFLAHDLGHRWTVKNYGMAATAPVHQYVMLSSFIDLAQVTHVVQFVSLDNDLTESDPGEPSGQRAKARLVFTDSMDRFELRYPPDYSVKERLADLMSRLELYAYTRGVFATVREHGKKWNRLFSEAGEGDGGRRTELRWLNLVGAVYQIRHLLKKQGKQYLVIYWPVNGENGERFERELTRLGVAHIDLRQALKRSGADMERLSFACDRHFNTATHAAIARIVVSSGFFEGRQPIQVSGGGRD